MSNGVFTAAAAFDFRDIYNDANDIRIGIICDARAFIHPAAEEMAITLTSFNCDYDSMLLIRWYSVQGD